MSFSALIAGIRPDADEGDGSSNVVGECRQAELAAHIFQPPHQESTPQMWRSRGEQVIGQGLRVIG